jgi:hypothetical protein
MHPDIQVRTWFFTKEDYEAVFKDILNHQCDLARNGIEGDDTHGQYDLVVLLMKTRLLPL